MRVVLCAMVLLGAACSKAQAQSNPALKPMWGQMLGNVATEANWWRNRYGLDSHWVDYCTVVVNADEEKFPKNGEIPLGADWRTMDDLTFKVAIASLESYRKGAMALCLSDVKTRITAASRADQR